MSLKENDKTILLVFFTEKIKLKMRKVSNNRIFGSKTTINI